MRDACSIFACQAMDVLDYNTHVMPYQLYVHVANLKIKCFLEPHNGIIVELLHTRSSPTHHRKLKACPHLIRIPSTSISHLKPLHTKLDQYWINPLQSSPHYELNSWRFVHKAQLWSCDSILATCWYIVLFLNIPSSWLWTLSAPHKYNNAFASCTLLRPLDIFYKHVLHLTSAIATWILHFPW